MTQENNITNQEKWLLIESELLAIEYQKKVCSSCIGTDTQVKQRCSRLNGCQSLCCMNMERWIQKKQKKEKENVCRDMITDLQLRADQRDETPYFFE